MDKVNVTILVFFCRYHMYRIPYNNDAVFRYSGAYTYIVWMARTFANETENMNIINNIMLMETKG